MLVTIPEYLGNYVMDLNGEIYALNRIVKNSLGRVYLYKECHIKTIDHCSGYKVVHLSKNGKTKMFRHHRLVAMAFLDNSENKEYVNHIDGNKRNNHPSNLEWVTARENTAHARKRGLMKELSRDNKGKWLKEKHYDLL